MSPKSEGPYFIYFYTVINRETEAQFTKANNPVNLSA